MARPARASAGGEVVVNSKVVEEVSAASSAASRESWVLAKAGMSMGVGLGVGDRDIFFFGGRVE